MMRSLYAGVSGMRTHQTKMDVIGNNIANVNTLAFKSNSITFGELMYQTTQRASGPNALTGSGGINARQIGLGTQAGAINTNIALPGASQTTGNAFDMKINGSSFFVVSDGKNNYFTRAGAFDIDGGGNLVMTSNGYNVMGWGVDETGNEIKKDTVTALRIMSDANMTYPPEATTKGYVSGIIDKNDTDVNSASGKSMNLKIYDNLGYSYTAKLTIKSIGDGTSGKYTVELNDILDANNESAMSKFPGITFGTSGQNVEVIINAKSGVSLSTTGYKVAPSTTEVPYSSSVDTSVTPPVFKEPEINDLAKAFGYTNTKKFLDQKVIAGTPPVETTIGDMLKAGTFGSTLVVPESGTPPNVTGNHLKFNERVINGAILEFDKGKGGFKGVNGTTDSKVTLNMTAGGVHNTFSNVEIDFSLATIYDNSGTSTVAAKNGDSDGKGTGRKLGKLAGVAVDQTGKIFASYDNGMTRLLGQMAVAEFPNPAGLEKIGDNLYQATLNSGEFDGIGTDVSASGGSVNTGVLEMSNVDLSQEFAEMITTQRGFQANSRIITVSDSLIEELVNLKR